MDLEWELVPEGGGYSPAKLSPHRKDAEVNPKGIRAAIENWARQDLPALEQKLKVSGSPPLAHSVADLSAFCKTTEQQLAQLTSRLGKKKSEKEINTAIGFYQDFLLNAVKRIVAAEIYGEAQGLSPETKNRLLGPNFLGALQINLARMIKGRSPVSDHSARGDFFNKINVVWKNRIDEPTGHRQIPTLTHTERTLAEFRRCVFEQLRGHFSFGYKKALREIELFYRTLESTVQEGLDPVSSGPAERGYVLSEAAKKIQGRLPQLFFDEISGIQISWTEAIKELKKEIKESIPQLYVKGFLNSQKETLKLHSTRGTHSERVKDVQNYIQKLKSPSKKTSQESDPLEGLFALINKDSIDELFEESELHGKLGLVISFKRIKEGKNSNAVNHEKITDGEWFWLEEGLQTEYKDAYENGLGTGMHYLLGKLFTKIRKEVKTVNPYQQK